MRKAGRERGREKEKKLTFIENHYIAGTLYSYSLFILIITLRSYIDCYIDFIVVETEAWL